MFGVGILEGRPLPPGAPSQDVAQPQEYEHRERQKDDGVDVILEHVSWSFDVARKAARLPKGGPGKQNRNRKPFPEQCKYARETLQWPLL